MNNLLFLSTLLLNLYLKLSKYIFNFFFITYYEGFNSSYINQVLILNFTRQFY